MKIDIVIGKNFGDEGKGLAVDYFAKQSEEQQEKCLVVKHNGGAQAGHTVDLLGGRFIFHQLSSGSFRGADTFWNGTYLPDLYKLGEEIQEFEAFWHNRPRIFASKDCQLVLLDDVLINQALEAWRGENAHGSCGMGINEAVTRMQEEDYQFSLGEVFGQNEEKILEKLRKIREGYTAKRLEELGISSIIGPYMGLLTDDYVLVEEAKAICRNIQYVEPVSDMEDFLTSYEHLIFEGAQGLLLDDRYEKYAPYLTPSRTGCHNAVAFLKKYGLLDQARLVYVTRTYVTRHGAGPLPHEITDYDCSAWKDLTNVPNPWQGTLRFARHGELTEFLADIEADLEREGVTGLVKVDLFLTHLNETDHKIWMDRSYSVEELKQMTGHLFTRYYLSDSAIN